MLGSVREIALSRIEALLGFGHAEAERPDDQDSLDSAILTNITISLGWSERLRMLVSGKGQVELLTWTDRDETFRSTNAFSVLPPRYARPGN